MNDGLRNDFRRQGETHTVLFGQITFSLVPNHAAHLEQFHEIHSYGYEFREIVQAALA